MEFFNGTGEALIIMVVVVGAIFAGLMILHVIAQVYSCTISCIGDKLIYWLSKLR